MQNELPLECDVANGLDELKSTLESLLGKSKQRYHILYKLGGQKSLISIDTTQTPYHFDYKDLLGRPATDGVKRTISHFLMNKFGINEKESEECFDDDFVHHRDALLKASMDHRVVVSAGGMFGHTKPVESAQSKKAPSNKGP